MPSNNCGRVSNAKVESCEVSMQDSKRIISEGTQEEEKEVSNNILTSQSQKSQI